MGVVPHIIARCARLSCMVMGITTCGCAQHSMVVRIRVDFQGVGMTARRRNTARMRMRMRSGRHTNPVGVIRYRGHITADFVGVLILANCQCMGVSPSGTCRRCVRMFIAACWQTLTTGSQAMAVRSSLG